jgi:hypothetical protein
VSRHASEEASYFLKVCIGRNIQRSESINKPTQHAYYEFKCLEVEWEPLVETL